MGKLALLAYLVILADPLSANEITDRVRFETTKGVIEIALFENEAPISVENFKAYIRSNFYDGTIFHRVIPGFMVQGGGFESNLTFKKTEQPIINEADNGLSNKRGTLAMARTSEPHSATGQFFINHKDNSFLNHTGKNSRDWGYAVFGRVTKGIEVVDAIAAVATTTKKGMKNVPAEKILINKAYILNSDTEVSKSNTTSQALKVLKRQVDQDKGKRKELERQLALLKKEKEQQSETLAKSEPKSEFPRQPINVDFKAINKRPDDIAVIIGNANYKKMGKDIPNVNPAYADAEGMKRYFMRAKGIREGNIIYLKDATGSQLASVFGNINSHKARLYNWVKPQESNVYVYYAGHGVPGGDKGKAYLVPTDADSQTIQFSGYPLSTLYSNLGKLPAKSITVILEACFSGSGQAGNLFANSSPIVVTAKKTRIPKNIKVISAGAVDQMASWEKDKSHGLFTKYFLKAMSGEGDKNKDGSVSDTELKNYLGETMTYYARRYYGRDQNVQIVNGN